jgi:hypothetical protein
MNSLSLPSLFFLCCITVELCITKIETLYLYVCSSSSWTILYYDKNKVPPRHDCPAALSSFGNCIAVRKCLENRPQDLRCFPKSDSRAPMFAFPSSWDTLYIIKTRHSLLLPHITFSSCFTQIRTLSRNVSFWSAPGVRKP